MSEFVSHYVPEPENRFLNLWPYRHHYIYARHTRPGEKPQWHTEGCHPLSDRKILAGEELYGVRFDSETKYLLIDIDAGSPYHPRKDPFAVRKMVDALEAIGLRSYVACTSSYSGGLHLYFPFYEAVNSHQLAEAAAWTLQSKSFLVEPGLLEIFPNPRNYNRETESYSLFNAHRLPLQQGSYLLDEDWNPILSTPEMFCYRWEWSGVLRNQPDLRTIKWAAEKFGKIRRRRLTYKAQKFLEDLNQCIDPGWTGYGQTNFILGRITLRSYVFGHIIKGTEKPLTGTALIEDIVETAMQLPGYREFCRHQTDIWVRAEEWARSAENSSHYYPFGGNRKKVQKEEKPQEPKFTGWNQWQLEQARGRIRFVIAVSLNKGTWPAGTTDRFNLLTSFDAWEDGTTTRLSGETLYHHADLWHPDFIGRYTAAQEQAEKFSPKGACSGGARPSESGRSLLTKTGVNPDSSKAQRGFWEGWGDAVGCNPLLDKPFGDRTPDLADFDDSGGGGSG